MIQSHRKGSERGELGGHPRTPSDSEEPTSAVFSSGFVARDSTRASMGAGLASRARSVGNSSCLTHHRGRGRLFVDNELAPIAVAGAGCNGRILSAHSAGKQFSRFAVPRAWFGRTPMGNRGGVGIWFDRCSCGGNADRWWRAGTRMDACCCCSGTFRVASVGEALGPAWPPARRNNRCLRTGGRGRGRVGRCRRAIRFGSRDVVGHERAVRDESNSLRSTSPPPDERLQSFPSFTVQAAFLLWGSFHCRDFAGRLARQSDTWLGTSRFFANPRARRGVVRQAQAAATSDSPGGQDRIGLCDFVWPPRHCRFPFAHPVGNLSG